MANLVGLKEQKENRLAIRWGMCAASGTSQGSGYAAGHEPLTPCEAVCEHFRGPAVYWAGALEMTRRDREELNRKLAQARRLALEPSDPLTRERLAQLIEDLEFQLIEQRQVA